METLRKKYVKLYALVADVYNHILLNTDGGEKALAYLESRGFNKDIIKKFNIGYSYKGNVLSFLLQRHGFNLELGKDFGLLKEHDKEPKFRDFFYGRVMIPIRNEQGEIIAFSGRVLPGNTHPAKYLNTPDTEFFSKGEIVFNLDLAKESIKRNKYVIVFEGYFDVITSYQQGIENVVCLMGTALTEAQIQKIRRYTNRVILCLDGDSAGWTSTKRNAEHLMKFGFEVRIATMYGCDPHEYILQYGKESFQKNIICNALDYHSFVKEFSKKGKDITNEMDCLEYINEVLDSLHTATLEKQGEIFRELSAEVNVQTDLFMTTIRSELAKR